MPDETRFEELPDPHSSESEQKVLGALLLDNGSYHRVPELCALHFFDSGHRAIFEHVGRLIDAGAPADVVSLADSLQASGKLDLVGGRAYLVELIENTTGANIEYHAGVVRERALLRHVVAEARGIEAAAFRPNGRTAWEVIDFAQATLRHLADASSRSSHPKPLDLDTLAGQPVPVREYRVGRIMAIGTTGEWSGHGGAGKTQCALHLAICLAAGRQFFGEPVKPSRVAFVSGEDDATELHRRLAQQAARLNVPLADLAGRLFVYDLTAADPTLLVQGPDKRVMTTPRYAWLKGEIERREADVIILDNRATLFDGEVNVPGTATRAIALFDDLAPAGGNVIVLAHVDKPTAKKGYSREAYSGTAAWHNRARWRWFLYQPAAGDDADEPSDDSPLDDGARILEVQKNNGGPVGARFPLRLVEGVIVADGTGTGIVASIERNNERKAVLAALREAAARGIDVPAAENGPSTAYNALESLPSFPAALRGKTGKRRVHRLLRQLRADREIEMVEFGGGKGRHVRNGYRLSAGAS